jgi:vitamin B12 transporter
MPALRSCKQVTETARFWEGRTGRTTSPETGQQGEMARHLHVARARGTRRACVVHGPLTARGGTFMKPLLIRSACMFAWLPSLALAQVPPTDTVVITGTREATQRNATASDVIVIDEATIRQSSADSLEDLLRREAGLQLSRAGGPGQTATLFVRGANAGSVVVLVDGVRVGSASVGQAGFEGLSLAQVQRVEVLRGPGSSLWGADASGGVVRITTLQGDGGQARDHAQFGARVAVGTLRSREASASGQARVGAFDVAASLARESSAGVSAVVPGDRFGLYNPDRDGFVRNSLQLKAGFAPAAGHRVGVSLLQSRLNAQYDGAEFAAPTFEANAAPDFRNRLKTTVAAADYRGPITSTWTQSLQLAQNVDDSTAGGNALSQFKTQRQQLTWQHRWGPSTTQQAVVALEHLGETVTALDLAAQDLRRKNNALVFGWTSTHGAHTLQADARTDRNSVFGAVNTGRVGWRMAIDGAWAVRANAGTSYRAPSFNELYFPGYGVATLRPERARSFELGAEWRDAATQLGLAAFRSQVRDLIGFQSDRAFCPAGASFDFGCAGNISRARLQGVSFTGAHRQGAWRLGGAFDLLDATDADTGQRLIRRAAHQGHVRADWYEGPWRLGAALVRVGARPDGTVQLWAYTTVDLSAHWQAAPAWRVEAKLNNATNAVVQPARDYQSPGRQAWLGLRYTGKGW